MGMDPVTQGFIISSLISAGSQQYAAHKTRGGARDALKRQEDANAASKAENDALEAERKTAEGKQKAEFDANELAKKAAVVDTKKVEAQRKRRQQRSRGNAGTVNTSAVGLPTSNDELNRKTLLGY